MSLISDYLEVRREMRELEQIIYKVTDNQLTPMEVLTLRCGSGHTMTQLAKMVEVQRPQISAITKRLEQEGYICILQDKDDRRASRVLFTGQAYRALEQFNDGEG